VATLWMAHRIHSGFVARPAAAVIVTIGARVATPIPV